MVLSFVEELECHCAMSCCSSGPQRGCNQRAFDYLFAGSASGFERSDMGLNAIWALSGTSDSQGNEFAIFAGDGAVFAPDDLVEVKPGIELCGGEFAHLFDEAHVCG